MSIDRGIVRVWYNVLIEYYAAIKFINHNYEDKKLKIFVISEQGMAPCCAYRVNRAL